MKPAVCLFLLLRFAALPVFAQDASEGPYAEFIKGEFAHVEQPLAENGLPLWLFADRKISGGRKKYPLLICLHGRRNNVAPGTPFTPQAIATPWTKDEAQRENPCFVVQPYYPPRSGWEKVPGQLDATIAHLIEHLPADPQRIYLFGFSNGAQGTFQTLARKPQTYAAGITVSGPVNPASVVGKIKAPIRAWVGENDNDQDKKGRCVELAQALKDDGVDIEIVVVEGKGHSCHGVPTGDPEVHEWLFSQKRNE